MIFSAEKCGKPIGSFRTSANIFYYYSSSTNTLEHPEASLKKWETSLLKKQGEKYKKDLKEFSQT